MTEREKEPVIADQASFYLLFDELAKAELMDVPTVEEIEEIEEVIRAVQDTTEDQPRFMTST